MSYTNDLKAGQLAEKRVRSIFESAGMVCENAPPKCLEWDLAVQGANRPSLIEVKFDRMQARTGNLAVEYWNTRKDNPSGLLATRADIWAFVLEDGSVWCSPIEILRRYVNKTIPARMVDKAGDGNAAIYLYPSQSILTEAFIRLDNLPDDEVRAFVDKL